MPRKAANTASADDMVSNYEPCYHSLLFYLTLCNSPSIFLVWKWSLSNIYSVDSILICWLLLIFPFWSWSIILIFLQWFHCLDIMWVCVCVCVHAHTHTSILSCVRLFVTPWSVACLVPLYWSGLPFPPPGDLSHSRTEPLSLAPPALAGRFFTTESPGEPFEGQPPCKHFLASEYCSPVSGA